MEELDDIHEVHENIYIGAYWPQLNFKKMKKLGIRAIINVMEESYYDPRSEGFQYLHEGFPDNKNIPHESLEKILDFMDYHLRRGNKVLIHCSQGLSRSPGVAIAWLLKEHSEWSWNDAFEHVNRSKQIFPAIEIRKSILDYLESIEGYRREIKK
ncbi:MAG: dual specificity protein phosphatase family protein [Promethearchaeota archaeon]